MNEEVQWISLIVKMDILVWIRGWMIYDIMDLVHDPKS